MSSITLRVATTEVVLPADLYWSDETTWQPVAQKEERSITGALIVQTSVMTGGRPITLQPVDADRSGWVTRMVLDQLMDWAAQPGLQMVLSLRGQSRSVIWRHSERGVIDARPVFHFDDVQPGDFYSVTLKFMEI